MLADSADPHPGRSQGQAGWRGALTWGTIPGGRAALRIAGLEPGKNVEYVAVGALGSGFQAPVPIAWTPGFNSSWDDHSVPAPGSGALPIRRCSRRAAGNGFIAHVDTLRDQPDLDTPLLAAPTTQAQIVCEANPAFCVKAFWQQHPESRPAGDEARAACRSVRTADAPAETRALHTVGYAARAGPVRFGGHSARHRGHGQGR